MKNATSLRLLNKVNEASAQLIGALNDGEWDLAKKLSAQRQSLALQLAPTDDEATADLAIAWERYRQLEQRLEATLEKQKKLTNITDTSTDINTRKGLKHYQSPRDDQTG